MDDREGTIRALNHQLSQSTQKHDTLREQIKGLNGDLHGHMGRATELDSDVRNKMELIAAKNKRINDLQAK